MKFKTMRIFSISIFTLIYTSISAQLTLLEGIELIDTNAVFEVSQARILGIDKASSPNRLVYGFVHPGGAIQQVRGSMMSGGKDPVNLPAYGAINLGETLDGKNHKVQWYSPDRVGTNVNFVARPLTSARDHMSANVIAKKGEIISNDNFTSMVRKLSASSPMYEFLEKIEKEEEAPSYVDHYLKTRITPGLSGKISYLTTSSYTLKPVEERNKGLFGTAYKMNAETNKENTKTAFGDDPTMMYKMMSEIPQINDPVTGHAVIFGGIKYKKNKSKENSQFYEFMFLTFNNAGEIVKRVKYDSKEPLKVSNVYPVYGDNLAPDVDEITHGIFVTRGSGNKKIPNINSKIRKVFVVDVKTGEIIKQDEIEFAEKGAQLIQTRRLDNNKVALTYYYAGKDKHGLVVMKLGVDGIENVKEISGNSPEFKAIGLGDQFHSGLKLQALQSFNTAKGDTIKIERFITKRSKEGGGYKIITHAYVIMKYDVNGNLLGLHGIGNLVKKHNRDIIKVGNGKISMMVYLKAENGASKLKIMNINMDDLNVEAAEIPVGEYLASSSAYHYDASSNILYFLTQKSKGKGISVFEYKM